MVDILGSEVTLVCLRQSKRVSFMGWLDTPSFFSGRNAWIVVFDVEHEEYLEPDIVRGDHTHWACLLQPCVIFHYQVNNGVLYYLGYVEVIHIRVLFVLVSILNPNHFVITPSNKLYTTIRASLFPFQPLT